MHTTQTAPVIAILAALALSACGGDPRGACNASTCPGCCFNDVCQAGNTPAACGKAGAECNACSSWQTCSATQACNANPELIWTVQPSSATIAPNNSGSDWDVDVSAPDVVAQLACPPFPASGAQLTATPEAQSYSPSWTTGGCSAKASDLLAHGFNIQAWDIDAASDDPITAALNVKVTETELAIGSIGLGVNGGLQSMTVKLTRQ